LRQHERAHILASLREELVERVDLSAVVSLLFSAFDIRPGHQQIPQFVETALLARNASLGELVARGKGDVCQSNCRECPNRPSFGA